MFPVLIAKGLTYGYEPGVSFIKDADLTVEPGAIQAVAGLSGSGKTTLARILSGQLESSAGTVHIQGKLTNFRDLRTNTTLGIRIIESDDCIENRDTVADALKIEGVPTRFGIKDVRELNRRAAALLVQVGMQDLDPGTLVCELPIGQRKLIEVASLISKPTNLLILDDPTAGMTEFEALLLYKQLSTIAYAGAGVLYFTSRAVEALQVGDRISVLREGVLLSNHTPEEVFVAQIVGEMYGRDISKTPSRSQRTCGPEVVLRVEGLTAGLNVTGLSLKIRRGEVLGLLGLDRAGQSNVVCAIGGSIAKKEGEIYLRGSAQQSRISNMEQALANGLGLIQDPLAGSGSAKSKPGISPQKDQISAYLNHRCFVLLFDNPTRCLSVASRFEIYNIIEELAQQGIAMVIASTDPSELVRLCDRIAVMVRGNIVRTFERREFSPERLELLLRTGK